MNPKNCLCPDLLRQLFNGWIAIFLGVSGALGQGVNAPISAPSHPGFVDLHSNLGLQEIVELGVPFRKTVPASLVSPPPPGPLKSPKPVQPPSPGRENSRMAEEASPPSVLDATVSSGVRLYQTNNVLRTKVDGMSSGVYEFNLAAGLGTRPLELGKYVTFIPRIDLMTQWAKYGRNIVKDLLDYQFSMVKGSVVFGLPENWNLGIGVEYDYLSSLSSGDKMFDANAPSFSIQKVVSFTDQSFLMIDSVVKYANTNRVIPDAVKQAQASALGVNNLSPFASQGVFADDGDNLQTTLSITYLHAFGPDGKFLVMPNLGFTRTSYVNNNHQGRVDYLFNMGASGIYQITDWLGVQTFLNYSRMNTNDKGQLLLGQSSRFKVWDFGFALNGNYRF
jgi:hypothetical protein